MNQLYQLPRKLVTGTGTGINKVNVDKPQLCSHRDTNVFTTVDRTLCTVKI